MKTYASTLEVTKEQFNAKCVAFKNFKGMTQEDVDRIKAKVEHFKKVLCTKAFRRTSYLSNAGLDDYTNTLRYLINPTIHSELKTFDERALFLILSVDPDLKTIKAFLESEIVPLIDIENAEDSFERAELSNLRREQINDFINKVRKAIGFYDANILKFENVLIQGLFKTEDFASGVKLPSISSIMDRAEKVQNLDVINNMNLLRLKKLVEKWNIEAKDPSDLNSLAYNLLNNYKSLRIFTVEEQVVLFMLVADPDLDLLKIFEEESKVDIIKERALDELGFYGEGFLRVEKLYHNKFLPTKQISPWTK